jgi:hypothetical protein
MSSWITDEKGKWHPAKETVNLVNRSNKDLIIELTDDEGKKFKKTIKPGQPYVYEGPDRAALLDWWEQNGKPSVERMEALAGNVTMGEGYRNNQEFLESYAKARQAFGFNTVEEYLKYLGYDETKVKTDFAKKASVVTTHEAPNRISEIKRLGGGDNKANPGKDIKYGGFGDPADMSLAR